MLFLSILAPVGGMAESCPVWYGDVSGDGAVDVGDVQAVLLLAMAELLGEAPESNWLGEPDITCDGLVDVADITTCIKLALGAPLSNLVDLNGNDCVDACEASAGSDVVFRNWMPGEYDPLTPAANRAKCSSQISVPVELLDAGDDTSPWFEPLPELTSELNGMPGAPNAGDDYPLQPYLSFGLAIDADGDGHDDDILAQAVTGGTWGTSTWVLHNGTGPAQAYAQTPIGWGDFNLDGHRDMIFSAGVALFIPGEGYPQSGHRYFPVRLGVAGGALHSASTFDVDGDGDQDIFLAAGSGKNRVLLNRLDEPGESFSLPDNFTLWSGSENPTTYYFALTSINPKVPLTATNVVVCEDNDNWGSGQICYQQTFGATGVPFWVTKLPPLLKPVSLVERECDIVTIRAVEALYGPVPLANRDGLLNVMLQESDALDGVPIEFLSYGTFGDAPFADPMGTLEIHLGDLVCQIKSQTSTFNGSSTICFDEESGTWRRMYVADLPPGLTTGGQRPFAWGAVEVERGLYAPHVVVAYGQNFPKEDGTAVDSGGCPDFPAGVPVTTPPPPCSAGKSTLGAFRLTADGWERRSQWLTGYMGDLADATGLGDIEGHFGSVTVSRLTLPGENAPSQVMIIGGWGEPLRAFRILQALGKHVVWLESEAVGAVIHVSSDHHSTYTVGAKSAQRGVGNWVSSSIPFSIGDATTAWVHVCYPGEGPEGDCTDPIPVDADTTTAYDLDDLCPRPNRP